MQTSLDQQSGTRPVAWVKSLHPDEVRDLGAHVILGNTYHLHLRPGEDVIEELGGLHAFSGWSGRIERKTFAFARILTPPTPSISISISGSP